MTDQFLTSKRDEGYWATIIFFMPLVLQRLFIGGTSGGYDSYTGYSFFWLGYVVHIGFISMLFLKRKKNNSNVTYTLFLLFAISILQVYYISTIFTGYFLSIFVVLMRAMIWIGAIYAFSILYFDESSFKKAFYEIIMIACIFIFLCNINYNLTGIPFGVNIEKGVGRVHGAFSEPSTLASVVPAFIIISLLMKKYSSFLLGIFVIYGAASVVVTAALFLCFIIYIFLKHSNFNKYFIYFIVFFTIFMTLSVNAEVVNSLDYFSAGFSKFLDNSIGQSIFRAYTIDRIITSIHDLATSLNYATDLRLEDSGGLARFLGSITMLRNMELDGTTWSGYGLSVYGFVANALYGSALDFGLYPYLISSFGIIFGTVFILILTSTVLKWQKHDSVMFIIFSGGLLGTIYNSGGGITAYSVVILAIFVQHDKAKKITSASPSERGDIYMIRFLGGTPVSPLSSARVDTNRAFYTVVLLSAALNILLLGGSIYMMMVYDMVLPSGSLPTLVGLLLLIIVVYVFQGFFDVARSRILADIGAAMDLKLSPWVHHAISRNALYSRSDGDGLQPMRDIEQIRGFLSGGGPAALIDLPWVLFFVGILFLMHAWLGITILCGALVLTVLTVMTERMSNGRMQELSRSVSVRNAMADANSRHAADATALGMTGRLSSRWIATCSDALESQQRLADISGTLGAISKMLRIFLQSVMLSVGAWIVIRGEGTGGIIFASAILGSRALAPVEQVIANWRGFLGARQGWKRLDAFLAKFPLDDKVRTELPAPTEALSVEGLSLVPPGANKPSVIRTSFALSKGDAVGIIGPSGSGKTTLVRGLLGIWPAAEGTVRLDGAAIDQWNKDALGQHIGYLPQNVELFNGTVAQNIARFETNVASETIVAAAKAAGVHDLILKLPNGYETNVDADGAALSAGQRQRVALARALFRDPFLVVLDEPNSNLDTEGEEALAQSIRSVRARGGIVVLVAHRPAVLAEVNLVLVMRDGMAQAFGPRDEVLEKVMGRPRAAANSQPEGKASPASVNTSGLVSSSVLRPVRR